MSTNSSATYSIPFTVSAITFHISIISIYKVGTKVMIEGFHSREIDIKKEFIPIAQVEKIKTIINIKGNQVF